MTQTLAVFYDAYRSLNAKKMFWIVLLLSALVAGLFACVGIDNRGLTFLVWQFEVGPMIEPGYTAADFYKTLYAFGLDWWLGLAASILALISTASIFPDLINSGSIHLLISKPISRLRLFALQYLAGLLFVTLQVVVFTLAAFLVVGLRGGEWEPSLFVAVPIVVCFFSYLFSVCVLLGVLTRSTLAALLLTVLFWLFVFLVGWAENVLLLFRTQEQYVSASWAPDRTGSAHGLAGERPGARPAAPPSIPQAVQSARSLTRPPADDDSTALKRTTKVPRAVGRALLGVAVGHASADETAVADGSPPPFDAAPETGVPGGPPPWATAPPPREAMPGPRPNDMARREFDPTGSTAAGLPESEESPVIRRLHKIFYAAKTVLPKTSETTGLLGRYLIDMADLPGASGPPERVQVGMELEATLRARSLWWIVGTSLAFEAFVLFWAALIFCRRDY